MNEKQLLKFLHELEAELIKLGVPRARIAPIHELVNKTLPALRATRTKPPKGN